jgi:hypothetical protein
MADGDDKPTEDVDSSVVVATSLSPLKKQLRPFLNAGRRDLSETELSSPAVQRFLIDDVERLNNENEDLRRYRDLYHQNAVELAVMREKNKPLIRNELMSYACLTLGAVGLGAAPSYITMSDIKNAPTIGWTFFIVSSLFVVIGFLARIWKR